jgi:biotin-(acetyl-CoA carboxylase) ligase
MSNIPRAEEIVDKVKEQTDEILKQYKQELLSKCSHAVRTNMHHGFTTLSLSDADEFVLKDVVEELRDKGYKIVNEINDDVHTLTISISHLLKG